MKLNFITSYHVLSCQMISSCIILHHIIIKFLNQYVKILTFLSIRPGRIRAGSSMSGLFVAATTTTLLLYACSGNNRKDKSNKLN